LFGEAQGRVVLSTPDPAAVIAIAKRHGVPARQVGRVRAASGTLRLTLGARTVEASLDRLAAAYHGAIPSLMKRSSPAVVAAELESIQASVG
jgi:hypothetical protein